MKRKKLEESGLFAIRLMRKTKLESGHPFMINVSSLPADQCYLEFPDGNIQLVTINRSKNDFEKVRELTKAEKNAVRKKLQFV